ncbi:MAG: tRNA (adenosine(37)-N6)-dimethylallyltransferase MiaA [Victivallales bacterium]|nr:tRNA (adenosine(37)-N6)-dimethylallyltransferase MiaA [Victivallales bacterium]MBR6075871.1 tRNA (adenosine(37)-N6)-dimethylallyltransferase MiaA [Victivallales bacterium]
MQTALVITGPTATGKTKLAVHLARRFGGEIISADSRQVYRHMDLGTGKDLDEYGDGADRVPCHLLDVVDPQEDFHLKKFIELALAAMDGIRSRNHLPVIAGGTPLYVNALIRGYDLPGGEPDPQLREELQSLSHEQLMARLQAVATPEFLKRVDITQDKRIIRAIEIALSPQAEPIHAEPLDNPLVIAPYYPRKTVRERIEIRLDERLKLGLVEEVRMLHQNGVSWEKLDWFGLEYRYVSRYLKNELTFDQMRTELLAKIRHFCKSQDIWFRKMEREGIAIHWIPEGDTATAESLVARWLAHEPLPKPSIRLADITYSTK